MNDVARLVVLVALVRVEQLIALEIELDHARGRHLLVEQAVRVDQEFVVRAGHAYRDVVRDVVGHPVQIHQPVGGGELAAEHGLADLDLKPAGYRIVIGSGRHLVREISLSCGVAALLVVVIPVPGTVPEILHERRRRISDRHGDGQGP